MLIDKEYYTIFITYWFFPTVRGYIVTVVKYREIWKSFNMRKPVYFSTHFYSFYSKFNNTNCKWLLAIEVYEVNHQIDLHF